MTENHGPVVYYMKDIKKLTGRSAITIRRWWKKGQFPKPKKLNDSVLAWSVISVQNWIDENILEENDD